MSKLFFNQKGVSLVEVMVAAGISSVIALGTMKINETSQQGMRNVATKSELTNYVNFKVGSALGDSDTCHKSFDLTGNGTTGDTISLVEGAEDSGIKMVKVGSLVLAEVAKDLPNTSGEFTVDKITFKRDSSTACTLTLDLIRNNADKKIGGKNLRQSIAMGCGFNDVSNNLETCSSKGASELGKWTYKEGGGSPFLQNDLGVAAVGMYNPDGGYDYPVPRLSVTPDNSNTKAWSGLYDAIGLPTNYAIRWGLINEENDGVGIYGTGSCIAVRDASTGNDTMKTCDGQTDFKGNIGVDGVIAATGKITAGASGQNSYIAGKVAIGGANHDPDYYITMNGETKFTSEVVTEGRLTVNDQASVRDGLVVGDKLTVGNGAEINGGQLKANGGLYVFGPSTLAGDVTATINMQVNKTLTIGSALSSGGLSIPNGSATVNNTIHANGKGVFGSLVVTGSGIATAWNTYSDKRFKTNIEQLDEPLQKILALEPVQYDWRGDYVSMFGDKKQYGLIAQDVKKVYPDIVQENEGGFLSVNYTALISPIIDSIKSLYNSVVGNSEQIEKQQREIASLKKQNEELKARLDRIEKALGEK